MKTAKIGLLGFGAGGAAALLLGPQLAPALVPSLFALLTAALCVFLYVWLKKRGTRAFAAL